MTSNFQEIADPKTENLNKAICYQKISQRAYEGAREWRDEIGPKRNGVATDMAIEYANSAAKFAALSRHYMGVE